LLQTLGSEGFVQQNPRTGKYRLGLRILELGMLARHHLRLEEEALPLMERLAERTQEQVNLAVLDKGEVLYLETVSFDAWTPRASPGGLRNEVHCTALGKVLLSGLTKEARQAILQARPLRKFTERTITDLAALEAEIERVRQQGYALDDEERAVGFRCVAAPIMDATGTIVAALSIAGVSVRLTDARLPELIAQVQEAARDLSVRLGARGLLALAPAGQQGASLSS